MKKTLLIIGALIVLSTTSLSWGGHGYNNSGSGCGGRGFFSSMSNGWHNMMGNGGNGQRMVEGDANYEEMRGKNIEVYNKYGIEISQKRLDVERELLDENPDWKKIGKLNDDIASLEAKARTEVMKNNYTN